MADETKVAEGIVNLLPVVVLSLFGGIIRLVNCKGKTFSLAFWFGGLLTSAFVGLMTHYLLADTNVSQNLQVVAVAISGYAAHPLLELLQRKLLNHFKYNCDL